MIEGNIVLTCVHNLVELGKRKIVDAKNIKVYLGRNGKADPSITYDVLSVKHNEEYFKINNERKQKKYDFALISLVPKPDAKKIDPLYFLSPSIPKLQSEGKYRLFELFGYDLKLNE